MKSEAMPDRFTCFRDGKIFEVTTDESGSKSEREVSREEWRRANPRHQDTGCEECTFAIDVEAIMLHHVARGAKHEVSYEPRFVGFFHMDGWSGHSGFYLFKCRHCASVSLDYPHGYTDNGSIYLKCSECGSRLALGPNKHSMIYEREGIVKPTILGFFRSLKVLLTSRVRAGA